MYASTKILYLAVVVVLPSIQLYACTLEIVYADGGLRRAPELIPLVKLGVRK